MPVICFFSRRCFLRIYDIIFRNHGRKSGIFQGICCIFYGFYGYLELPRRWVVGFFKTKIDRRSRFCLRRNQSRPRRPTDLQTRLSLKLFSIYHRRRIAQRRTQTLFECLPFGCPKIETAIGKRRRKLTRVNAYNHETVAINTA